MYYFNFLLFDAARAGRSLFEALEHNSANRSLYHGTKDEDLAGVGPFVFTFKDKSSFADWFFKKGWGNSWGILLFTTASFDDIFKHFTKFLIVRTEDRHQYYFRFYDPRVLRIFLPTCDKDQLKEFFGPVKMFTMEDEDPEFALQFWLENYELKSKRVPASELFGTLMLVKENVKIGQEDSPVKKAETETTVAENMLPEIKKKRTFI